MHEKEVQYETKAEHNGSIILIRLVFLRMATSEPLPQRPTHKSRRLRGQEPQQATPEKVVGTTPHNKMM